MFENMLYQFKAFYTYENLSALMVLVAVALALVFAVVWLIIYRPWTFNKAWWVVITIIGAFLTWTAIAFIQIPLQTWTNNGLVDWLGADNFLKWLLVTGIPLVLLSGLVQEAAKLVPVIFMWSTRSRQLDPLTGLYAGAISGAGFGILEAVWVHNSIFSAGWTWDLVSVYGTTALLGFWERFFTIGLHIASGALAGYGWAKGWKWQFYLIATGLHALANYGAILLNKGSLTTNQVELYVAVVSIGATVLAFLMLRNSAQPPAEVAPDNETTISSDTEEY
jgi:RsiW-degrading membrane proteinase PrsW (M82 family)